MKYSILFLKYLDVHILHEQGRPSRNMQPLQPPPLKALLQHLGKFVLQSLAFVEFLKLPLSA